MRLLPVRTLKATLSVAAISLTGWPTKAPASPCLDIDLCPITTEHQREHVTVNPFNPGEVFVRQCTPGWTDSGQIFRVTRAQAQRVYVDPAAPGSPVREIFYHPTVRDTLF